MRHLGRRLLFPCLAAVLIAAASLSAGAHQLRVFASPDGGQIGGQVYFVGGGPARNAPVTVEAPGGEALGATETDSEGTFTFTPERAVDHTFIVDLADGHRDAFTVTADSLPIAAEAPPAEDAAPDSEPVEGPAEPSEPRATPGAVETGGQDALRQATEEAVSRQIRPLREQIDALAKERRLQDIVGGIGYIFGIIGLYIIIRQRFQRR